MGHIFQSESPVCFMVINHIPDLPQLAVDSVLKQTTSPIVIGYINQKDISNFPQSTRVSYLDLSLDAKKLSIENKNGSYKSFDQDDFFKLVQLKWAFFERLLDDIDAPFFIYSDVDVFWFRDASNAITELFKEMEQVDILVQDFTSEPANPRLCMGLFVFRNSDRSAELIKECRQIHALLLEKAPHTGDDDVITNYYREYHQPNFIRLLPQATFPVGNLLNLFTKKMLFPGLRPPVPFIFHSNFVTGNHKKLLLTLLISYHLRLNPGNISGWRFNMYLIEIFARNHAHSLRLATHFLKEKLPSRRTQ